MADQKSPSGDKITSVVAKEYNGNIQITFTIPFGVIKKAEEETIQEFAKDTEVAGFRKGKAPIDKVKEKVPQNTLIEHSLSHILPKALAEAVADNKLQIAIYPRFELISAKEGESWQIRGLTCELPKVELGDYKKIVAGELRSASIIVPGKDKGENPESTEASRDKKEQTVIKALLDGVKPSIPQILIEEEADSRLSSLLSRLEKLGLALESYLSSIGKKAEDMRADYAKQAKDAISIDLILTKIAEAENIKIDQKDIENALNMSQASKVKDESEADRDNRKRLIESILRRRAALDFLINLN
jgi:FKBP-type peptidyl-prolyl cis-trans isomerase (trigger factor)